MSASGRRDLDRKSSLLATHSGSPADVDLSKTNLMNANAQLEQLMQHAGHHRNQLLGDPNLPAEKYPPYQLASAALDQAKRRPPPHRSAQAPIAGIATQADNIQLGRYLTAGTLILSVIDDQHPWVDANPKETEHHLSAARPTSVAHHRFFSDRTYRGVVSIGQPLHRRAVLDPAAAERERQLGQGRAAVPSCAHHLRPGGTTAAAPA